LQANSPQSHADQIVGYKGRFAMDRVRFRRVAANDTLEKKSVIRKVVAGGTLILKSVKDRFYHMDDVVRNLTEDYRAIVSSIRQRQRLNQGEHRISRLSSETGSVEGEKSEPDPTALQIRRFVVEDQSDRRQPLKETRASEIPEEVSHVPIRSFVAESYNKVASKKISGRLENFIQAANNSAFETYGLHIALRLRLGKMINHRTKRDRKRRMVVGQLETHLIELRAYNEVLYSSTSVQSASRVHNKLMMLELRNQVQRSLVLSTQSGSKLRGRTFRSNRTNKITCNNTASKQTEERPHLRIRYRRNQRRNTISPYFSKPKRVLRHTIRRHLSYSRRVSQRPHKAIARRKLAQTVSFWLGEPPAKSAKVAQPVSRRPFGSNALESDGRSGMERIERNEASVEEVKKEGRRRPGAKPRLPAILI
jgi:hypothetical protein